MSSKSPEASKMQNATEDEQCGTLPRSDGSSYLLDGSSSLLEESTANQHPGPLQSTPKRSLSVESNESSNVSWGGYLSDEKTECDDLNDDRVSQSQIATKSDILYRLDRLEVTQEAILANQNAILENLRGISSLLKEKAKKRGILKGEELNSNLLAAKKPILPTPFPNSTPLTNSVLGGFELQSVASDEIMPHGSEDASSSLEVEPKETTSQGRIGFPTTHSETSRSDSSTVKVTMTSAELKIRDENKACLKDICDMVGTSYSREELAESSYEGGKRKYKGRVFTKKGLSPARLKKIMSAVSKKHPEALARLRDSPELKEAVNMKCRKTSSKPKKNTN